jgi:hypothetical protein
MDHLLPSCNDLQQSAHYLYLDAMMSKFSNFRALNEQIQSLCSLANFEHRSMAESLANSPEPKKVSKIFRDLFEALDFIIQAKLAYIDCVDRKIIVQNPKQSNSSNNYHAVEDFNSLQKSVGDLIRNIISHFDNDSKNFLLQCLFLINSLLNPRLVRNEIDIGPESKSNRDDLILPKNMNLGSDHDAPRIAN